MKSNKLMIIVLALGVLASVPSLFAKGKEKQKQVSPEQYVERVEQAAGPLTAEQKTKITGIVAKVQESASAMSADERKANHAEFQKRQNDEIRAVLTTEQQAKFDRSKGADGSQKSDGKADTGKKKKSKKGGAE